jgi:hypothetical protein
MSDTQPTEDPQRRGSAILPITARKSGPFSEFLYGSPQLTLTLARDKHSSGISVWLMSPSGSKWPSIKCMGSERWNAPLPGEEGCLEIAIQYLQQLLGEVRGLSEKDPTT